MNRGTALKWIDAINSGRYNLGTSQLRHEDEYCAIGVLADFLDPNGWNEDFIGYNFHDDKFKLPANFRKKAKIKTEYCNFVSSNGLETDLETVHDFYLSWDVTTYFIEKYYEQF